MPVDGFNPLELEAPLALAIEHNNVELFDSCWQRLNLSPNACQQTIKQRTFNLALTSNCKEIVTKMCEDPIMQSIFLGEHYNKTDLLKFAAQHNCERILAIVLKSKNIRRTYAAEALLVAVKNKHANIVSILIGDPHLNFTEDYQLGYMLVPGSIIAIFLQDFKLQPEDISAALIAAVELGEMDLVEMLLDDERIEEKAVARGLRWAAVHGHKDIFALLIKHAKQDADAVGYNLYFATEKGSLAIVSVLLEQNLAQERHLNLALRKARELKHEPIINALTAALDLMPNSQDCNAEEQQFYSRCRRIRCSIQ